ncbi:hypothetical protein B0A49_11170 [Cryomyces minteri]|uniref:Cleavage/polyadenylation specificity factor A subunit N-terminal domain-containing protein n=1 Tax=Cryomyces minteri TaxID=331657 RepID=A0A4U0WIR0_9PEZI|nr:hypothetical protein B0A49_11170 [Cryomyces minteri]
MAGLILCISGNDCLIAQLDDDPKAVPRRLNLEGTPNRLVYSEQLQTLIAATIQTDVKPITTSTPRQRPTERRVVRGMIEFLPTHGQDPIETFLLHPGEKVYALAEWTYTNEQRKRYWQLVLGTGLAQIDGGQRGRLTFLQRRVDEQGRASLKIGKYLSFPTPVYAIAAYEATGLILTYSNYVSMFRFSVEERKWVVVTKFALESPGIHITTAPPLIHVTTAADSVITLHFTELPDDGPYSGNFKPVAMEGSAREGAHHLELHLSGAPPASLTTPAASGYTLLLASDKRSSLIGLHQRAHLTPSNRPHANSAPLLFEAALPRSITRLRHAEVRPPWKQTDVPGVVDANILGSAADGSIFQFSILAAPLWRLLRFVQNLCQRDAVVCPHSSLAHSSEPLYARDVDPDALVARAGRRRTHMHVDGDVLARLLERGGARLLEQMLGQVGMQERFVELVAEVLPLVRGREWRQVVDEGMGLLRAVLESAL